MLQTFLEAAVFRPILRRSSPKAGILRRAFHAGLVLLVPACAPDSPDPVELPPVVAESRYLQYGTWADSSMLCMDAELAEMDAFIEATAAYLDVKLPATPIRYTYIPVPFQNDDNWPCAPLRVPVLGTTTRSGCFHYIDGEPMVFTSLINHPHELVHALSGAGLVPVHPLLEEGLATYLSSRNSYSQNDVATYANEFLEMLDADPLPSDYGHAARFVGSILERHGLGPYKELRSALPVDADADTLAAHYLQIYGETLASALSSATMLELEDHSGFSCSGEPLTWTDPVALTAKATGECGDAHFVGGGFIPGTTAFGQSFVVEIAEPGAYTMTISGSTEMLSSEEVFADLLPCPGTQGEPLRGGLTQHATAILDAGPYVLRVSYPPNPSLSGEWDIDLEMSQLPP